MFSCEFFLMDCVVGVVMASRMGRARATREQTRHMGVLLLLEVADDELEGLSGTAAASLFTTSPLVEDVG